MDTLKTIAILKGLMIGMMLFIVSVIALLSAYLFTGNTTIDAILQVILGTGNLIAGLFVLFTYFYLRKKPSMLKRKQRLALNVIMIVSGLVNLGLFVCKIL